MTTEKAEALAPDEIFDSCCGLCGHEIREWEFRTILPNTINTETANIHADCARARFERTEEHLDNVYLQWRGWVVDLDLHWKAMGNSLLKPGAVGRGIAREKGTGFKRI